MTVSVTTRGEPATQCRVCHRVGCCERVKKPTAKYCSVACCATDPARIAVLRARSRARSNSVLPMARQLTMPFANSGNPEAILGRLCEGRDDVPGGMSRLVV